MTILEMFRKNPRRDSSSLFRVKMPDGETKQVCPTDVRLCFASHELGVKHFDSIENIDFFNLEFVDEFCDHNQPDPHP